MTTFYISFKLLPLFFLVCLFSQSNGGDPCPQKKALHPCTCSQVISGVNLAPTEDSHLTTVATTSKNTSMATTQFHNQNFSLFTTVECKGIKTQSDLEDKFSRALDRKWVDKLIISKFPPKPRNTLAELPSDWLNNVRIQQLQIQNSQLCGDFLWKNQPLRFQTQSLHWLTVNNCNLYGALTYDSLGTVHTRGLNVLNRLQGIDFSSNYLLAVVSTAFRFPPKNLTTVILARNNIIEIQPYTFSYISLLRHVDLSHNQLETIRRNAFAVPANNLESIDLSWNSIQSLPVDFFNNMTALRYVNISYNFLFSLPEKPWSVVWGQLSSITVSGNFIECDCELLWILPLLDQNATSAAPVVTGRCAQPRHEQENNFQTISHDLMTLEKEDLAC